MASLGIDVLFKGTNFLRLLQGLWVSIEISLISVAISIVLGLVVGILMTLDNKLLKAILKIYLETVRIMPQMVLLFIVLIQVSALIEIQVLQLVCNFNKGKVVISSPIF